ncbi:hypothetical protein ACP4OV_015137 [Aristida adscensionis]
MAGQNWVLDIIWHGMLLGCVAVANLWSSWTMEILIAASLLLHILFTILGELRWFCGRRNTFKFFVWLFYMGTKSIGKTAMDHLSVSSASGAHQLVVLWAGFFLLHLALPDSISAYSIEDSKLSWRDIVDAIFRVLEALYVVSQTNLGSRTMVAAAWMMVALGSYKYIEKTAALYRADLEHIRKSFEENKEEEEEEDETEATTQNQDDPVQLAQSLFENIGEQAIVDASGVNENPDGTSDLLDKPSEFISKVVERQVFLMFDFIFTKAAVIHTTYLLGYCIRFCSPIFAATAFVLFEMSNKDQDISADVVITRVLLSASILLETVSLLRAIGSSWAASPSRCHHKRQLSAVRHKLHLVASSLPGLIGLEREYRKWSGNIGEFNLPHFCSIRDNPDDLCSYLAMMVGIDKKD